MQKNTMEFQLNEPITEKVPKDSGHVLKNG